MNPLYKRCPNAVWFEDAYAEYWRCDCHGTKDMTLLPASFDDALPGGREAAIERMVAEVDRGWDGNIGRGFLNRLLRAAAGERG